MFGDYAKALQDEGTSLDNLLSFKGNWHHIWRDAASADVVDSSAKGESIATNLSIPHDLSNMMRTNSALMKGMQSSFDKKLNSLQAEVNKARGANKGGKQGGKGGKNKEKKRNYWSASGPGNQSGGNDSGSKSAASTGGGGRSVKADRGSWDKKGKRGN